MVKTSLSLTHAAVLSLAIGCSAPAVDLGETSTQSVDEAPPTTTSASSSSSGNESSTSSSGGTGGNETGSGGSNFASGGVGTGGSQASTDGTAEGGGAGASPAATLPTKLVASYCQMEAACISGCRCKDPTGGYNLCPCNSPQRREECAGEVQHWFGEHAFADGPSCEETLEDWVECMAAATCDDARAFLRAHPDDVVPGTPCHDEYYALTCNNFEPPYAEYMVD